MHRNAPVATIDDTAVRTGSLRGAELGGFEAAGVAVHRPDGHIQLEFAAEEDIDLELLKHSPSAQLQVLDAQDHEPQDADKWSRDSGIGASKVSSPPLMSICILIVGTRGDVQPFLAIAQRLQEDGHRVRLATHAVYRDFVMGHGVEFYPLGGDPKELAAYMVKTGGHLIPTKLETLTKDVPRNKEMINEILNSTWPAVSAIDPDGNGAGVPGAPFRAQAIIANPVSYGHIHVAERLGVPLHIMFPQPWVPTMAFPHPLSNLPYTGKWQKKNFISYKLVDLLMWQGTEGIVNAFRTKVLKLRKIRSGDGGRDLLLDLAIPHAFMWSPRLVPKPADWGNLYDVIGTVTLEEASSTYNPSRELEAFLGSDGGPIFVGFGSMVLADPLATTKMIIEAAQQANVRVLIQSSWSDMAGDLDIPSNVFFLGNCPHDWLMPRVSAVVHHGGAGTTAAGLLAGKPTFIVPFFGDQPFWGQAVVDACVGVPPCPIAQLTTERLRGAFEGLASPELRARALALRDIMRQEDGAGEAVRSFYRHLPTQDMWCDLDHQRIAIQWSVHDRLKLCDRCAFITSARPENRHKKLVRYHSVDYSARGPDSLLTGAAAGTGAFFHEVAGGVADIFVQPAKGFAKHGVVGAVTGAAKGVGYFLVRPVHGAVLFADHVATGHKNANREEGHRKQGTVFDQRLMTALGAENGLADTYSSALGPNAVDIVLFARRHDRERMLKRMPKSDKRRYCAQYEALLKAQKVEKLQVKQEGMLFPTNGWVQALDEQQKSPNAAQQRSSNGYFTSNGSSMLDTDTTCSSTDVEHIGADESKEPPIAVRSARLTSLGTVEMNVDVPSEAADEVSALAIAEWEAFSSFQQEKAMWMLKADSRLPVPGMNICLAAVGTWNNGVKQFVAIGIQLKAQGHRVRLAANERFRVEIMARGLEFYPLAGAPESIQDFAIYLRKCQDAANAAPPGRAGVGAIQTFKELIYSLWPAAYGSDPHGGGTNIPGGHFRADSLLWHPLLLGHVHVAERLGIPVQCASLEPLSPTFAFPHILSSISGREPATTGFRQSNYVSHGVVDTTLWHGGVAEVLAQFRAFIGLPIRCERPNPLVEREIPHVYLWNPTLLPKPLDWGMELAVVGHVTLGDGDGFSKKNRKKRERESKRYQWPKALAEFAFGSPNVPVIYFGVSTRNVTPSELDELLRKVDAAVAANQQEQQMRIIFQTREVGDEQRVPYRSACVYQIASDLPYARLLREVTAAIHWGEADISAEALAAGRPVSVCGSHPSQLFVAHLCERAQVGLPPINCKSCTVESLASTFQELLKPGIRERAQALAATFNPERAVTAAVKAFYANLPLEAMRCDVDKTKLARVFDPHHGLRLSLWAYLAVQPLRGGRNGFVPYKPLTYGGSHPPTFSIRGNPAETSRNVKPTRRVDAVGLALEALESQDDLRTSASSSLSALSAPGSPVARFVNVESFWTTTEEETAVRQATTSAYERLVKKPQRTRKRDALLRLFGAGKQANKREAQRYITVQ
ncbi:hypothetical protein BBJ28_00001107 [Nothophytophthora sp. Chile5]|nr:hypothetical protein BBJ28_00001107 [Nothophytophthora sp. Chile5]